MRKVSYLALLLVSLSFTGCIDIIEEIFLNKDGSGQYTITMDASGVMAGGGLRSLLQMAESQEEGAEIPGLEGPIEMDSVIYFKNATAELREQMQYPEILDRISIHQQVSEKKELMKTVFAFDFNSVAEIDKFKKDFSNLGGMSQEMGPLNGMMDGILGGSPLNNLPLFTQKGKLLTRAKTEPSEELAQMSGDDNDESMQMVEMVLADASYKVLYHLPGAVKKSSLKNARIEGKDVTVEVNLLESMKGKVDLSGFIKYKGR